MGEKQNPEDPSPKEPELTDREKFRRRKDSKTNTLRESKGKSPWKARTDCGGIPKT